VLQETMKQILKQKSPPYEVYNKSQKSFILHVGS